MENNKYSKFGNFLARGGGMATPTPELLATATPEELASYDIQRKTARNKGLGEMLLLMGDAFQGRDISGRAAQRRASRQPKKRETIKGADGYNYYLDTGERVLPGIEKLNNTQGSQERFGVYGADNTLIGTVLKGDQATIARIEQDPNQRVGQLRSPTIKSKSSVSDPLRTITMGGKVIKNVRDSELTSEEINKINQAGQVIQPLGFTEKFESNKNVNFEPIKKKYLATENIIVKTSELAQKFYNEPTSALAVGRGSQFVDSVIQNLDQGLNLMSSAKDKKSYQYMQKTSTSLSGKDFSGAIKQASQTSGVAESRIRDLGYLFAAARGQEGRGLSDKDFENALKIVSGGVGAEGRAMVLQDVSNSLRDEFYRDVNFDIQTSENQAYVNRLEGLPQLPTFVMPSQAMPIAPPAGTPSVEDLLNKYGG
tara:strand:+ start:309 stop:1586 length:1278 start_codon:yes stop_codon:yes gene_type:complete